MTPEQKELFRLAVLRVFDANNTRFGLQVPAVGHLLAMFGFPSPNQAEVEDAIDYLVRKGLLEEVQKTISRENRAWRITKAGVSYLDQ